MKLVKMPQQAPQGKNTNSNLGYWQGLNYIVTSIFRVCRSEFLTTVIMYRMLNSDELGLKQTYKEEGIRDICFQLKKYMQINLNEIYKQIDAHGVEVDFFALTWIVTWMFHFRNSNSDLTSF